MLREFTLCEIFLAISTWWQSREIMAAGKRSANIQQNTPTDLKRSSSRRGRVIVRGDSAEQLHAGDVRSDMQLPRTIANRQQLKRLQNRALIGIVGKDGYMIYGRGKIRRLRR